jgi:hypothetical protein
MVSMLLQLYIAKIHGRSSQDRRKVKISRSTLIVLSLLLLIGSIQIFPLRSQAYAAYAQVSCSWYMIRPGNTLSGISRDVHTDVRTLASINNIRNINLIFAGQQLCIPEATRKRQTQNGSARHAGIASNGTVRWYAYDALEGSTSSQAKMLMYSAAAYYGLPVNLLLAIAWQESGWQQHIISGDGGVGMMQIMPSTATWLNSITGLQRDPYKLRDNIFMGAYYVRYLYNAFHGNIQQVVSAYNEGDWAVSHNGIMNWNYVNDVLDLSYNLR